jgi:hypothetical protein
MASWYPGSICVVMKENNPVATITEGREVRMIASDSELEDCLKEAVLAV